METTTSINTDTNCGTPLIKVRGDLDYFAEDEFRLAVKALVGKDCRNLVVDMSEVEFMDSGGMSGLVYAVKLLAAQNGRLWLAACNARITHKMQIAGFLHLQGLVNFTDTVDVALSAANKNAPAG